MAFSFFIAGFETSASTLAFALYELSFKPEIQKRIRTEISEVLSKYHQDVTYDGIQEMPYLHMVVSGEQASATEFQTIKTGYGREEWCFHVE